MRESYYTGHASHAFRFYAKNQNRGDQLEFRSKAERLDWNACEQALTDLDTAEQQEIVLEIYREEGFRFRDKVRAVAHRNGVTERYLWILVDILMKSFAKNRGLI